MIQDLIVIKEKLRMLHDEMITAFQHYSDTVDANAGEQDVEFTIEAYQLQNDLHELTERMADTINSYIVPLGYHEQITSKKMVKPYDLSHFINHQDDLLKIAEQTLHIPMKMDLHLIKGLTELVYQYGWGRTSGMAVKVRPDLRFLMIAVSGWMLIKKYGGEFILLNGLSVKIAELQCIIQLEDNSNNAGYFDWYSHVTVELDACVNGEPIPKSAKGIIKY